MSNLARVALTVGAAALLAACAGSQAPIGAPGVMPQSRARPSSSGQYNVLFRFSGGKHGRHPWSGLIDVKGTLYGTTYEGGGTPDRPRAGSVYAVNTSGAERVLHDFGGYPSDGALPLGDLLDVNGTLYGTTFAGGVQSTGTFYRISLSGKEKVLISFADGGTNNYGLEPAAGVIDVNGTLYGTTELGCGPTVSATCGPNSSESYGIVYRVGTTGKVKVLYSFSNGGGVWPEAPVIDLNGTLYGTTYYGGASYDGVVYSVGSSSGKEHVLHAFTGGSDGRNPAAGLLDVSGTLYGTTEYGGGSSACKNGCGTVFSIGTSGAETVLHAFAGGSDGAYPRAALIDVNGTLYGTTAAGGSGAGCAQGCGTIFSITPSGTETVVHNFANDSDGWAPLAELLDVKGTLYGTTYFGGLKSGRCHRGCGTVFSFVP